VRIFCPIKDALQRAGVNGRLPTTLDGVSVSIGGRKAYVYFISSAGNEGRTRCVTLGQSQDAIVTLQRALAIRPSVSLYSALGAQFFLDGRYQDAATAFESAVAQSANSYLNWANLGDVYRFLPGSEQKSKSAYASAIRLVEEALHKTPDDLGLRARLASYRAKAGQRSQAAAELKNIPGSSSLDANSSYAVALAYEFLGNRAMAIEWLVRAANAGYSVEQMNADSDLLDLRKDARYHSKVLSLLGEGPK
jgi:predicted Zn-dependent protease